MHEDIYGPLITGDQEEHIAAMLSGSTGALDLSGIEGLHLVVLACGVGFPAKLLRLRGGSRGRRAAMLWSPWPKLEDMRRTDMSWTDLKPDTAPSHGMIAA